MLPYILVMELVLLRIVNVKIVSEQSKIQILCGNAPGKRFWSQKLDANISPETFHPLFIYFSFPDVPENDIKQVPKPLQ